MRRAYYIFAYYLSFLVFGTGALLLNLVCAVLLVFPAREVRGRLARGMIHGLFGLWPKWLNFVGVVRVSYHGFSGPIPSGVVVVANHPSLIDATVLLARMPGATCIFKPQLMRNPVVGPAAIAAGYTSGSEGIDTIRTVAEKVSAGRSLLIFPEGTRTSLDRTLGTVKAGFALIADRGRAPVQLVILRATKGLVARGRPWWRYPQTLPAFLSVTLDRRWEHDPDRHAMELATAVEQRLREVLG